MSTGVILQPGYLPWMGFFDQMSKADIFVVFDDVQYTRRDWRTRNRIKLDSKPHLLSVPVQCSQTVREKTLIRSMRISYASDWQRKQIETMRHAYSKAPYFDQHSENLFGIISQRYDLLLELLMETIRWMAGALYIETNILLASSLNVEKSLKKTDRLIAICKKLDLSDYLTGESAKNYISEDKFKSHGIKLHYHDYTHPIYSQVGEGFIPNLSAIDYIFNCGNRRPNMI